MKTLQLTLKQPDSLSHSSVEGLIALNPQIVFAFGNMAFFKDNKFAKDLKSRFPEATVVGCSTAGEIANDGVTSGAMVVTSVRFDNPQLRFSSTEGQGLEDSYAMGKRIAEPLKAGDLKSVFLLLQGVEVNGSEVIRGMQECLGNKVLITGGLAGDGGHFASTIVMLDEKLFSMGGVAIGFYGDSVQVSFGSVGGWEAFGPTRKITRAKGNILYELDNTSALSVYKNYLGEFAKDLPGSALHFPLAVIEDGKDQGGLIRTILGIDESNGSLILAGDVQQDGIVRLMHAQTPSLIDGARAAGKLAFGKVSDSDAKDSLAILVSCVGRKLVIGDDEIDDEVEATREALQGTPVTGFYSNGEICPIGEVVQDCRLHNQTMTITYFRD